GRASGGPAAAAPGAWGGGCGGSSNRRQGRLLQCPAPTPWQIKTTVGACLQAIASADTPPRKNRRQGRLLQCPAQAPWQIKTAVGACLQAIASASTASGRIAGKAGSYSALPRLRGK